MLYLLGITVSCAVTLLAYRLPTPSDAAAPGVFSAYRARAQLETLLAGNVPHPMGSAANTEVRTTILQRLSDLGYDTEVQSGFVCNRVAVCGTPSNIIARLRTDQKSLESAVLLAAHYDSVPAGPGASDDAAGVAAILEIARILAARPLTRHPIVLLISDGEEAGLLGASLFVRDHPLAATIGAAVNLEARGSSGPSLMFETGSANAWLMGLYRNAVARPITDSVYYAAYKTLQNDTDFSVFKSAGWQGFNFAYIGDVGRYHTQLDNLANADLHSIQHQGDNALASLLALADSDAQTASESDAVYFDVLSRVLITWPASAGSLAAAMTLASLLIETVLLVRYRRVDLPQIAWGCVGAILCLIISSVAGIFMLVLMRSTAKVSPFPHYAWIAHSAWMTAASVALGAAAAVFSSICLARRAGFWGFWSAAVLLTAISAVALAWLAPGTSFLALLTAIAAAIAVIPSLTRGSAARPASAWRANVAALAPAWMLFALLLPLVSLLYSAIGAIAWPIDTLLFGWGAMLVLPLLAAATARLRRNVFALSTAVSLAGVLVTLLLPSYSQAWPQRLDFAYLADADQHSAVWVAQPDSMQLPPTIARAAAFENLANSPCPGSLAWGFYAIAPWQAMPAPQLTLRAAVRQSANTTRYLVHLQSMRSAPKIDVSFPSGADVHDIILIEASGERHIPLMTTANGMTRLQIVGLAPQGLDFAVDVHGDSLEACLLDQSYTLSGGEFLQRLRSPEATSSQDGDTTAMQHTVVLDPAAGR